MLSLELFNRQYWSQDPADGRPDGVREDEGAGAKACGRLDGPAVDDETGRPPEGPPVASEVTLYRFDRRPALARTGRAWSLRRTSAGLLLLEETAEREHEARRRLGMLGVRLDDAFAGAAGCLAAACLTCLAAACLAALACCGVLGFLGGVLGRLLGRSAAFWAACLAAFSLAGETGAGAGTGVMGTTLTGVRRGRGAGGGRRRRGRQGDGVGFGVGYGVGFTAPGGVPIWSTTLSL